ncbi:MAG: sigma-70 family RNA polymerase sigma factor [Bryobacteraceae bacterium]
MYDYTPPDSGRITGLLRQIRHGDRGAESEFMALVYPDLRKLAARLMRDERKGHTLQATAVVHEAYLRLAANPNHDWKDRVHFFALVAGMMRRILVDHARKHQAGKRGGAQERIDLDRVFTATGENPETVVEVDCLLTRLEKLDPRLCRIVELRFFGSLTEEETAEALGVSSTTVKREWRLAKAWIATELTGPPAV